MIKAGTADTRPLMIKEGGTRPDAKDHHEQRRYLSDAVNSLMIKEGGIWPDAALPPIMSKDAKRPSMSSEDGIWSDATRPLMIKEGGTVDAMTINDQRRWYLPTRPLKRSKKVVSARRQATTEQR
ncbi:hypothetical protein AVEN_166015-1 [Araneus ventricosus]|uniref:Uncharacterized protein n=1 Tax=Araneus ventricosus TaxID=182803 RepID=A0A4Y2L4T9_ARAVE|nr:hypothetical protein AVEN_166015-1 [Araneus ventricosus]